MWAALKSPLILGNDLRKMDATTLSIINNPAIIAISQDPKGKAVQRIARNTTVPKDSYGIGETHIWSGPLDNGDQVVIFLNAADEALHMSATLSEIFITDGVGGTAPQVQESWAIHDLWSEGTSKMSKIDAASILSAGDDEAQSEIFRKLKVYNATETPYSEGLAASDKRLFGQKVGVVAAGGEISVEVARHAAQVFRLRRAESGKHASKVLIKQEL